MSTIQPADQASAVKEEKVQHAATDRSGEAEPESVVEPPLDRRDPPEAIADPFDIEAFNNLLNDLMVASEKAETPTRRRRRARTFKKRKHRHVEHLPEAKDDDLEQIMAENLASRLAPSGSIADEETVPVEEILAADESDSDEDVGEERALVVAAAGQTAEGRWWPPQRTTMFGALALVGLSVGIAAGYRPDVSFADLGRYFSVERLGATTERKVAEIPGDDLAASLRQAKIGFNDDDEATVTATNNIDTSALDSLKGRIVETGAVQMASLGDTSRAISTPSEPARRIAKEEADKLIERGVALMKLGQLSSARLMFKRAIQGGDPRGAKMMGQTYDPVVFRTIPVAGLAPDREKAEFWYERSETMPAIFEASSKK